MRYFVVAGKMTLILLMLLNSVALVGAQEIQQTEDADPAVGSDDDLEKLLESQQATAAAAFEAKYPEIREAATQFSQREFKEAEATLTAAKSAHPELPPAGVMLGKWYAQIRNSMAARTAY